MKHKIKLGPIMVLLDCIWPTPTCLGLKGFVDVVDSIVFTFSLRAGITFFLYIFLCTKHSVIEEMESIGRNVGYLCTIIFGFYQQYCTITCITEALVPSNTKEFSLFDAPFADGVRAGIAHVVYCLFTAAAYVPP